MKTIVKLLAVLALALGTLGVSVPAALAQPNNDTFENATTVSFGFSEDLDTTEATTDGDDAQLNEGCVFSATDASVWYAFTTDSDQEVLVNVQAEYSATVMVGEVVDGGLQAITCGWPSFYAIAGQTYYVLVFDDQFDGVGNGGKLSISFPPPPTVEFTVNPSGTFNNKTGAASVSGTYTCSTNADFIEVYVNARQDVGRLSTIVGFGFDVEFGTCDGEPHNWSRDVFPQEGKFAGGNMRTNSFATVCDRDPFFICSSASVEQLVKLKGGGPKK